MMPFDGVDRITKGLVDASEVWSPPLDRVPVNENLVKTLSTTDDLIV